MKEYLDVVNEKDEVIGKADRTKCHKNHLLHRLVNIIILNSAGEILIQKRSEKKELYPEYWTSSVTGHVKSGQSYSEAAEEELREELGISGVKLNFIGKYRENTRVENHIVAMYEGIYINPIKPNEREIKEIKYVSAEELKKMLGEEKFTPCAILGFREYFKIKNH